MSHRYYKFEIETLVFLALFTGNEVAVHGHDGSPKNCCGEMYISQKLAAARMTTAAREAELWRPGVTMADAVSSSSVRLLAPATCDPVLHFDFDWTARVAEVAPHLLAHGEAYLIGKPRQRLACGTAAAFKGAVIGVE